MGEVGGHDEDGGGIGEVRCKEGAVLGFSGGRCAAHEDRNEGRKSRGSLEGAVIGLELCMNEPGVFGCGLGEYLVDVWEMHFKAVLVLIHTERHLVKLPGLLKLRYSLLIYAEVA